MPSLYATARRISSSDNRSQYRIQHWGHWVHGPPGAPKKWNLTNFWRKKWLVCNIMNYIRNWSPLAAMTLFPTRKHNTVEWPKMYNLQNGIYTFFRGIHPRIFILVPRRFAPLPPLVANWNLCYYRTWDICVGKLHLAPPKKWSRGDGRIHPTYLKKLNLPLNVLQQFTPILLNTIF